VIDRAIPYPIVLDRDANVLEFECALRAHGARSMPSPRAISSSGRRPRMPPAGIALKTGTSYGYRERLALGFEGQRTVDAFARIDRPITPPPAPKGAWGALATPAGAVSPQQIIDAKCLGRSADPVPAAPREPRQRRPRTARSGAARARRA
jgi:hypothetical protein